MKCKDCRFCKPFKAPTHSVVLLVSNCWKHNKAVESEETRCQSFMKKERTELER